MVGYALSLPSREGPLRVSAETSICSGPSLRPTSGDVSLPDHSRRLLGATLAPSGRAVLDLQRSRYSALISCMVLPVWIAAAARALDGIMPMVGLSVSRPRQE